MGSEGESQPDLSVCDVPTSDARDPVFHRVFLLRDCLHLDTFRAEDCTERGIFLMAYNDDI